MATPREQVLAKARAQLGVAYYSMNFNAVDGYAGWMGTHYVGKGWGCAQFVAHCLNAVLGTKYVGSCYNYAGDALGQSENQGGGEFEFISASEALPGDAVIYGAKGYDGKDYDDYGHIALYIGNGKIIGAMGSGKPGQSGYLNIGIRETSVGAQQLGGVIRYIRCKRLPLDDETEVFPVSRKVTVRSDYLRVRDKPSTVTGKEVARYDKGDTVNIDGIVIGDDGYAWGTYVGGSGNRRYIALGMLENAR